MLSLLGLMTSTRYKRDRKIAGRINRSCRRKVLGSLQLSIGGLIGGTAGNGIDKLQSLKNIAELGATLPDTLAMPLLWHCR